MDALKKTEDLLANNLIHLRHERELTQAELAEKADISLKMIQRMETRKVNPSFETIDKVAKALDVSVSDLFSVSSGGLIPASLLGHEEVRKGLKQAQKAARARAEGQLARKLPTNFEHSGPLDGINFTAVQDGLNLIQRFLAAPEGVQVLTLALVFDDPSRLKLLSPEFVERLVQALKASQK